MQKPLADLLRPNNLDEMVGQTDLLKKDSVFRRVIEANHIPNMIFYGPPGTGKTTMANIIAKKSNLSLYRLNGTTASTEDIKKIISDINSVFTADGILLYLDEIQYLNKKQQQSLLEFVESGDITLIASTTENPYFYIYPALLSRCTVFEFKAIPSSEIAHGLKRAIETLHLEIEEDALQLIADYSNGDMRKALNNLDFLERSLTEKNRLITKQIVTNFIDKGNISYDRGEDKHYDNLSALMKSLRGSDPDASLFYLAKLLEGGDLIAACRRLLCSASEDVGLAYPQIIPIVKAAVDTALQLGMPEARLPLSNAAILIATAPKSNSALAIDLAISDIHKGKGISVPRSLQNTHFDGEEATRKGQNYLYPHSYGHHWVNQQYLPDDIKESKYYIYGDNKYEQALKAYWEKIKK
ncbi:MAG: replication-associated recombination protein A [Erysipelotrichaceae bacterium]|jgi:putative ATPase|nr:replication-associated recombination protein A [Erysipelotrichaceae bacterium]HPY79503.1 replication-associated recombination protein A [Bacilli bacterium]HQA55571.1 replication-associated recombination protein A [Bacilli bacterium]